MDLVLKLNIIIGPKQSMAVLQQLQPKPADLPRHIIINLAPTYRYHDIRATY